MARVDRQKLHRPNARTSENKALIHFEEAGMSFFQRLLASLQHRAETVTKYETELRAEDGFVPSSQIKTRGLLRIF